MLNTSLFCARDSTFVAVHEKTQSLHVPNVIPLIKIHSLVHQQKVAYTSSVNQPSLQVVIYL